MYVMNVANCSNDAVCIHTLYMYVVEWTLIIFNRIVFSCVHIYVRHNYSVYKGSAIQEKGMAPSIMSLHTMYRICYNICATKN